MSEIFSLILENTSRLDYRKIFDCLLVAAGNGSAEISRVILTLSVLGSGWGESFARLALWDACSECHDEVVRCLLDIHPELPLECAVNLSIETNKISVMKVLIENARRQRKRFFLSEALQPILHSVDKRAFELIRSPEEQQLIHACADGDCKKLERLIQAKVPIPPENTNGLTPLWTAICNGHDEIVRVLLKSAAPIYLIGRFDPQSAFDYDLVCLAIKRNQPDILQTLLEKGVLFFNFEASTTAIIYHEMDVLKSLNVNIYDTDDYGNTLLHFTAEEDYLEAAKFLLSAGASKTARNIYGQTPAQLAHYRSRVVKLFQD
ncbi:hypothetical protein SI65_01730 [Aspergillus cristatus]|uniref:Uncharacterized protein n=1 Tax=Aspergillus cristatus TaxID=573508 RepID=A0A1E3BT40_ASPCR|nr:hypothetical protein SI65_01730 [Aspergillus cristatus]